MVWGIHAIRKIKVRWNNPWNKPGKWDINKRGRILRTSEKRGLSTQKEKLEEKVQMKAVCGRFGAGSGGERGAQSVTPEGDCSQLY